MKSYDYYNALWSTTLKGVSDYKIPGYRRGSWTCKDLCGVCVKNVNTEQRFRYVLHSDGKDVYVELYTSECSDLPSVPVSPEVLKKFLKGTKYEKLLVEKDGHLFIRGCDSGFFGLRPSYDMCMHSMAHEMVDGYGDALAVMMTFPKGIHTLRDALDAEEDLRSVGCFVNEMEKEYAPIRVNIQRSQETITRLRNRIAELDKEMSQCHEKYQNIKGIIHNYGIKLEREL